MQLRRVNSESAQSEIASCKASGEPAIRVRNLGINFSSDTPTIQAQLSRYFAGLAGWLRGLLKGNYRKPPLNFDEPVGGKWVFRNFNFDVFPGEVFGIVGSNGCGKTTLLKILSSVLFPTEGQAEVRGRVASLLAVGTGFNMQYSGVENIYLNGLILGLTREEIDEKYSAIVEFADIGDAINIPVQKYSSGMRARLAFAVAAQLESDIVILDEVLAVGDAGFREKSLGVIRQMKRDGRTIIIVSHAMNSIEEFCDRAMLIRAGSIACTGLPNEVTAEYMGQFRNKDKSDVPLSMREDRFGSGAIRINDIYFSMGKHRVDVPMNARDICINIEYEAKEVTLPDNLEIGISIKEEEGRKLVRFSTDVLGEVFQSPPRIGKIKLNVPCFPFVEGTYVIGFRALSNGELADHIPDAVTFQCEEGDFFGTGISDLHSPIYLKHDWHLTSYNDMDELIESREGSK